MGATPPHNLDDTGVTTTARGKRTNNACRRCRERKVRCSNTQPCQACLNRHDTCIFDPEEKKITVSERYLAELRLRAGDTTSPLEPLPPAKRPCPPSREVLMQPRKAIGHEGGRPSHDEAGRQRDMADERGECSQGLSRLPNPLSHGPSEFVTDSHGRRRFLGPSSTWAYSQQVMHMMRKYITYPDSPEAPLNIDGGAFTVNSPALKPRGPLTMEQLPSLDFSLYLMDTVKFRLGQLYHLYDEMTFLPRLHDFYDTGPRREPLPQSRLWYIQYLLLTALGQALLFGFSEGNPAGMHLMSRALELLPDTVGLYQDPILSIEVLCCLSLHLQSLDHRNSAYVYVGLALRMALSQGLHREMVLGDRTEAEVQRHRAIWWTIYILDRKFSSLMGAPTSIQDEDITVNLPGKNQTEKVLRTHVTMSRLLATVVDSVYRVDGNLGPSFLKNVQWVLRSMAAVALELEQMFELTLDGSRPISRVAATLNLYYHQCIVLATRPLLVCLLQTSLEERTSVGSHRRKKDISEPIKALLKTTQESACKSLNILMAVRSQQLLDLFLPFDLESTFSCAFVLYLMSAIPSIEVYDLSYATKSSALLDHIVNRGNVVAQYRKGELSKLLSLIEAMEAIVIKPSGPAIHSQDPAATSDDNATYLPVSSLVSPVAPIPTSFTQSLTTLNGLSPENMLSVAGLLDWVPDGDFTKYAFSADWLWAEHDESTTAVEDSARTYNVGRSDVDK
ncbi:fungal-specific transcription factor domain-containing protein [Xylaria venustula]|nr:fungal-specific transcription factor domain-containing protein [Xylaria venustula]